MSRRAFYEDHDCGSADWNSRFDRESDRRDEHRDDLRNEHRRRADRDPVATERELLAIQLTPAPAELDAEDIAFPEPKQLTSAVMATLDATEPTATHAEAIS